MMMILRLLSFYAYVAKGYLVSAHEAVFFSSRHAPREEKTAAWETNGPGKEYQALSSI